MRFIHARQQDVAQTGERANGCAKFGRSPQLGAIVRIEHNLDAGGARDLRCFKDRLTARLRKRGRDASQVQEPRVAEIGCIEIGGCQAASCRTATVVHLLDRPDLAPFTDDQARRGIRIGDHA